MYKEANTIYPHTNTDQLEQDEIAHYQNLPQSTCTQHLLLDAFGGR